jgi:hypothetical protein
MARKIRDKDGEGDPRFYTFTLEELGYSKIAGSDFYEETRFAPGFAPEPTTTDREQKHGPTARKDQGAGRTAVQRKSRSR